MSSLFVGQPFDFELRVAMKILPSHEVIYRSPKQAHLVKSKSRIRIFIDDVADESLLLIVPTLEVATGLLHQAFARLHVQAFDVLFCNITLAFVIGTTAWSATVGFRERSESMLTRRCRTAAPCPLEGRPRASDAST